MIRNAVKKDDRRIARIDREGAKEIRFHGDVIPETVLVSEFGAYLAGFGYVLRGQGPYLHLVVRVNPRSVHAAEAAEELFKALKTWFLKYRKQAATPRPVLRLWCRDKEDAYQEFLEENGFRAEDRMLVMERKTGPGAPCGNEEIREVSFKAPETMDRYIRLTEEAYGMPDRAEEMRYRLSKGRGKVFALHKNGVPVSFVTVWPFAAGTYATENVFTVKAEQRKGYAGALLNEIAARLGNEGVAKLRLTVYEEDEEAIRLYRKIGYRTAYTLLEYRLGND